MKMSYSFAILVLCASAPAFSDNYPHELFSVSQLRVDSVRQPHGFDWYLQSREAKEILSSVAGYMGVNPVYVKLALEELPKARTEGEETFYDLHVPDGYAFCSARIGVRSIAPGSGDRASVISANTSAEGVSVYTWTPVRHFGEGRSWVEADVQVMGIKSGYLDEFRKKGVCKAPANRVLSCRGNPCSGIEHGRIQDAGPTTGDLAKGF